jgi:hypothetical protein
MQNTLWQNIPEQIPPRQTSPGQRCAGKHSAPPLKEKAAQNAALSWLFLRHDPYFLTVLFQELQNDVRVKSIVKALRLVKLHKQLKGLGERPVLGRWILAALVPLPARVERERAQGVCAA